MSGNFVVWAGFYWIGRVLRCDWAGNCQSHLATLVGLTDAHKVGLTISHQSLRRIQKAGNTGSHLGVRGWGGLRRKELDK